MSFDGAIESFGKGQITGWVRYKAEPDGATERVIIELRSKKCGTVKPTLLTNLSGGRTGFRFTLDGEFQRFSWQEFLNDFECVIALRASVPAEQWRVPFFKSVLGAFDPENRTAVLAERSRQYSLEPKPGGRIAAFTIVYNEHQILPLWTKYYSNIVGAENVFVIDQGSESPYSGLPPGVSLIRLPRESFDNWLIMRLVATFQRHLLESYDAVIYADSDEFLCVAPDALKDLSVKEFLLSLPAPVGITRGYNLHHDILREPAIELGRPVLEQRKFIQRERTMDKPMISRIPLNWIPGFHSAREGGVIVPGLIMLHLRWYDLDSALAKGGHYRNSRWDPYDIEKDLASYQRASEDQIVNQFRRRAELFAKAAPAAFDENADVTLTPDWIRLAF